MVTTSHTIEETKAFAEKFLQTLTRNKDKARVVGLRGDLGSGKTAFVKSVASILGVAEEITSPTFVIEKLYKLENQAFSHLIHIDAYRLEGSYELSSLGWEEIIAESGNVIMIEWPQIVADVMPNDTIYLDFKFINETTREIVSAS
jgi:tRNA threonylcarbamoyladenosine biosynthesis protein TsaE